MHADTPQLSVQSQASVLAGVRLHGRDQSALWDVKLSNGRIDAISAHGSSTPALGNPEAELYLKGCVLAPSLCHPHIHLDKCFLLSDPKYSDLVLTQGTFAEALELTSKAKSRFEENDLLRRGRWLIKESIAAGVTCMRAFVEVDTTVRFKCLDVGLMLKDAFKNQCEIQICVFAQDPIFSGTASQEGRQLVQEALSREGVDALGSTPYVEQSLRRAHANIDWAVNTAIRHQKHLDLHLDYHLDVEKAPTTSYVIETLRRHSWVKEAPTKTIILGHCTRLTLFTATEWQSLRSQIADLPVSFVGLPSSDLFMMGKPSEGEGGGQRVRGTLQILQLIRKYDLKGSIGVNNVGNAFTPQGNCDPLSLASLGVGIYQAGTNRDAELLYECVSTRARDAIGCKNGGSEVKPGDQADIVLFGDPEPEKREARARKTIQEIVYDPPKRRTVVFKGCVVAD
ncbi:MAG: hypothetical protein Q9190_002742 [Brigantiaea leucoxantha]